MPNKILLIDDDLYLRELYDEVFKNEGFEVDTAQDGKEGLGKIMANQYDLILLDVMLPQIDGLGILTKLSQEPPKSKLPPIILLTNLAQDPAVKEALSMGAKSVLIKANINPDQLIAEVRKFLGEKPAEPGENTEVAAEPMPTPPVPEASAAIPSLAEAPPESPTTPTENLPQTS